ncbi:MAG: PD-(D/E)XK motif protein [Rhodobacteraceae bacterium]|nr:PD-(D/E)XK motif protein [Paracoccaceae bacterium]
MHSPDPWTKLGPGDARRVNFDGKWEFFWVVLEDNMPGLMLGLPESIQKPEIKLPKLKNIVISFRLVPKGKAFVLGLKEKSQVEIFETLCRNVVTAGESAESVENALFRAIQRTRRWHYLLRSGKNDSMSLEEQRGLIGELACLRDLVNGLGKETAIEAWTGPFGSVRDFELIGSCIEVKTRKVAARPYISISSEDQLADVEGCRVFLQVVNVASAVIPDGNTLHDFVRITGELFEASDTALEKWENAIYSTGYDPANDYENRRWMLQSTINYEVLDDFPRISSPLPSGVEKVRYNLSLENCEPFKLDHNLIETLQDG